MKPVPQYVKEIVWFHTLRARLGENGKKALDWYADYVLSEEYVPFKEEKIIVLD